MDPRAESYLRGLGLAPEHLEGWTVEVAKRAGQDVAIVATQGAEIHLVSLVGPRAMTRRNTLAFLQPLLERYGYATTRVPIDETNHKLREHLGFTETWNDGRWRYFAMTALPFQKEEPWKPRP